MILYFINIRPLFAFIGDHLIRTPTIVKSLGILLQIPQIPRKCGRGKCAPEPSFDT